MPSRVAAVFAQGAPTAALHVVLSGQVLLLQRPRAHAPDATTAPARRPEQEGGSAAGDGSQPRAATQAGRVCAGELVDYADFAAMAAMARVVGGRESSSRALAAQAALAAQPHGRSCDARANGGSML